VDSELLEMEFRFIAERTRQRVRWSSDFDSAAWNPRLVNIPPGERFLVFASHPDDDAIGCGGTIIKLLAPRKSVRIIYLSIRSSRDLSKRERLEEIVRSLAMHGAKDCWFFAEQFPSEREIVSLLEEESIVLRPESLFVPSPVENYDQDLEAFGAYVSYEKKRKTQESTIPYEVWTPLIPNMIVDVSQFMDKKLEAVAAHRTQMRDSDYVRAVESSMPIGQPSRLRRAIAGPS
jgi:LmbE family N-acetylglucosaminyl deacetylase